MVWHGEGWAPPCDIAQGTPHDACSGPSKRNKHSVTRCVLKSVLPLVGSRLTSSDFLTCFTLPGSSSNFDLQLLLDGAAAAVYQNDNNGDCCCQSAVWTVVVNTRPVH